MNKVFTGLALLQILISCTYFNPEQKPEAIARVNNDFLYRDEINGLVPPGTSKVDSIALIRGFIDRWASRKLLVNASEINLSDSKKAEFDALVIEYKLDLYTKGYIEEIVKQSADTLVSEEALAAFYKENKENFRTNGMLVRLRYIRMQENLPQLAAIKSRFFNYKKSDGKFWETHSLHLKNFAMNDTIWVDMGQIYTRLPFINPDNRDSYMIRGRMQQHEVDGDIYLVKITDVIDKNQISPYEYVKPTLREVLLNKKKLELIKKFEKDITDDAIKDNNYEIYK